MGQRPHIPNVNSVNLYEQSLLSNFCGLCIIWRFFNVITCLRSQEFYGVRKGEFLNRRFCGSDRLNLSNQNIERVTGHPRAFGGIEIYIICPNLYLK